MTLPVWWREVYSRQAYFGSYGAKPTALRPRRAASARIAAERRAGGRAAKAPPPASIERLERRTRFSAARLREYRGAVGSRYSQPWLTKSLVASGWMPKKK